MYSCDLYNDVKEITSGEIKVICTQTTQPESKLYKDLGYIPLANVWFI